MPWAEALAVSTGVVALGEIGDKTQLLALLLAARFRRPWPIVAGILVATLGYTLTITGGLMLGRENDKIGQALLVTGGATGTVGTVLMIDSFKYLGRAGKRKKE